jgi:hypothetical protein
MSAHYKHYLSLLAGAAMLAFGAPALACGSGSCKPKPPCCAPKPTPPKPPKPQPINIDVNAKANAKAVAKATARANATANANNHNVNNNEITFFGGGGSNVIATPGFPVIQALNVGHQARKEITETRKVTKKVFIRAVCIDDRGGAHGASQLFPEADVRDGFRGELYRCVVGSKLQVTYGETEAHGESLACSKGQALWYGDEKLECRAQTAQRNCFERSLLRRFGTGGKVLVMSKLETYTRVEEETHLSAGSIALDGGVGGYVH